MKVTFVNEDKTISRAEAIMTLGVDAYTEVVIYMTQSLMNANAEEAARGIPEEDRTVAKSNSVAHILKNKNYYEMGVIISK